jgi:hypothetical protein
MPWGIEAPNDAMVSWSGRAIYKDGGALIDIPHDRHDIQHRYPDDNQGRRLARKAARALTRWVQGPGMKALHAELKKLWITARDERTVRIEQDGYVIVATPRRSFGYLYLGAWPATSTNSVSDTG